MHRVSISVEPAVYQLLKKHVNRSKYISDLVLKEAYETHKAPLVDKTKQSLLGDVEFLEKLKTALSASGSIEGVRYTDPEKAL